MSSPTAKIMKITFGAGKKRFQKNFDEFEGCRKLLKWIIGKSFTKDIPKKDLDTFGLLKDHPFFTYDITPAEQAELFKLRDENRKRLGTLGFEWDG